ncbi:phospholipid transfer protein-like isoform 2-T2 [Anableps anableps]
MGSGSGLVVWWSSGLRSYSVTAGIWAVCFCPPRIERNHPLGLGDGTELHFRFSSLRMTSCVFPFLLLVSLVGSVTAVGPTGLKLRITDKARDVLKEMGLRYLKMLVNKRFTDIPASEVIKIRWLQFSNIAVNPAKVGITLQEKSGVVFTITDVNFAGTLEQDVKLFFYTDRRTVKFQVRRVSFTVKVGLDQNQHGQLNGQILYCNFRADSMNLNSSGIFGWLWNIFTGLIKNFFNTKACSVLKDNVTPAINSMLGSISMKMKLEDTYKFTIDYSLSRNINVTSSSLDVSFKGLVFRHGESVDSTSIKSGTDPVFSESNLMGYVGISEFLFNSAAMSLYKSGPFQLEVPEINWLINLAFTQVNLPKGPVAVNLTKAPTIRISESGLSVNVEAAAQSVAEPTQNHFLMNCQLHMKLDIEGCRLVLISKEPQCKITSLSRPFAYLAGQGVNLLISKCLESWFDGGVILPLPAGLAFTETKILYHNGFLTAGGNLTFTSGSGCPELQRRSKGQPGPSGSSFFHAVAIFVSISVTVRLIIFMIPCCIKRPFRYRRFYEHQQRTSYCTVV